MRNDVLARDVDLQLAAADILGLVSRPVDATGYFDPVAADNVHVGHEANLEVDVALVGLKALEAVAGKVEARLQDALHGRNVFGQKNVYAQELGLSISWNEKIVRTCQKVGGKSGSIQSSF